MGGHQANPGQASAANAGASTAASQNASIGSQASSNSQSLYNNLFGSSGTISQMANPNNLNVTSPTGTYLQQYNNQASQIANSFNQQRGQLSQNLANRGFGSNSPAYFGAQQQQQLNAAQATAQGQAYTSATQNQYNQALQNFWNANQLESSAMGSELGSAVSANQAAGQTYSNLYGTAGQYVNPLAQTLGAVGSLLGAASSGAMTGYTIAR